MRKSLLINETNKVFAIKPDERMGNDKLKFLQKFLFGIGRGVDNSLTKYIRDKLKIDNILNVPRLDDENSWNKILQHLLKFHNVNKTAFEQLSAEEKVENYNYFSRNFSTLENSIKTLFNLFTVFKDKYSDSFVPFAMSHSDPNDPYERNPGLTITHVGRTKRNKESQRRAKPIGDN